LLTPMKARTELVEDPRVQRLKDIIKAKGGFKIAGPNEPEFLLRSGKRSKFYFNGKTATLDPEGISIIAEIVFEKIANLNVDSIGGLALGSIPIATAVAQLSYKKGKPIPAFWKRESQKEHGDQTLFEGTLKDGSNVVVVDDVATLGSSIEQVVDYVLQKHCKIVKIVTLLDREEGAATKFRARGFDYVWILKKSDFT